MLHDMNYHHLRYFWAVVREGGITRASERLHVSQPAVSAQLRELERNLGARLYTRSGRSIVLTDVGRLAYQYAEQIFGLARAERAELDLRRVDLALAERRVALANLV